MYSARSHAAWTSGAKRLLSGLALVAVLALAGCGGSRPGPPSRLAPPTPSKQKTPHRCGPPPVAPTH